MKSGPAAARRVSHIARARAGSYSARSSKKKFHWRSSISYKVYFRNRSGYPDTRISLQSSSMQLVSSVCSLAIAAPRSGKNTGDGTCDTQRHPVARGIVTDFRRSVHQEKNTGKKTPIPCRNSSSASESSPRAASESAAARNHHRHPLSDFPLRHKALHTAWTYEQCSECSAHISELDHFKEIDQEDETFHCRWCDLERSSHGRSHKSIHCPVGGNEFFGTLRKRLLHF